MGQTGPGLHSRQALVGVVCGWSSVHSSKWVWAGFPIFSVGVRLELEL